MAESKIDLVVKDRWTEDSGEEMVLLSADAELPANDIRIEFELPKHSADRLMESYLG